MSQEQPPLRSRRELRQARSEAAPESGLIPRQQQSPPPRADRVRRASSGPLDSVPERGRERSSQVRARDRAALRAAKEQTDRESTQPESDPPTRRQMRRRQLQEQSSTSALPVVPPAAGKPAPDTGKMTVEQALAARSEIAEQAKNHLARMEQSGKTGPNVVDPDILKEQMALAEKAAAINRLDAGQQRRVDPATAVPRTSDPATATNLGTVPVREFVQVPGVARPVLKPAATSSVPVVTESHPKVKAADVKGQSSSGRSWVIARAEAAARAADAPADQAPPAFRQDPDLSTAPVLEEQAPVAASTAYGLEPLDAATAGLARAQRTKYLQYGVLALGVLALVTGLILIISGMTR